MKLFKKNFLILFFVLLSTSAFSQIYVKSNGKVGIGTNNPYYKFHVAGRGYFRVGNNVIRIFPDNPGTEIGTSTDKFDFWYSNTGHNKIYVQKLYNVSDSTLKTNILPLKNGLNIIMKLNSYSYFMKEDNENPITEYGFLSQEVEKVLPEITSKSKDVLMINYIQVIPILVEAVKEQQKQIEILQQIVYSQENELINLKSANSTQKLYQDNNDFKDDKSVLYDNTPNPFNIETEIKYYISENTISANIIIYDLQGKEMKSFNTLQKGYGSIIINSSELYAGMFVYTLIVDNKIIDTKRMILTSN